MSFAAEVHARLGASWPAVLAELGIADSFLRLKKAGPCPACGGIDRYTFDNRHGRGDFICRGCGAGDGFALLERVHRWTFREALQHVSQAAGLAGTARVDVATSALRGARTDLSPIGEMSPACPTQRVHRLVRESCAIADCPDAADYLAHRGLWPLPPGCTLRAHASAEYFDDGKRIGRFAALIASVRDVDGALVTAHVTYLHQGRKLTGHEPRKILSPLTGRVGCAVQLMPVDGETLGIAEGLETALAAHRLHGVPVWSALNAGLLSKFEPPPSIRRLLIFADRDPAGMEATARLAERLQGRVNFELRAPPEGAKDWNDQLTRETT